MTNEKSGQIRIKRALISTWNKEGIVPLAEILREFGCTLISTGGTARHLKSQGIEVVDVSSLTDFPPIFSGRVKTLHPAVFGGILMRSENQEDQREAQEHGIEPIQMVVIDFYPFEEAQKEIGSLKELVEYIDIGGPSMVRAAAKNFHNVAVLCDKDDYSSIIEELKSSGGHISFETRKRLAQRAFAYTSFYDSLIFRSLGGESSSLLDSPHWSAGYRKVMDLRYGENPHQKAALYADPLSEQSGIVGAEVLWGKKLSFNNIVDADACLQLVLEFEEPCCAIIKHTNPCGLAVGRQTPRECFEAAFECDPVSSFGGIVGFNQRVDEAAAEAISKIFLEIVLAPSFTEGALEILKKKKNLRIVRYSDRDIKNSLLPRGVVGGLLVQELDVLKEDFADFHVPTEKKPGGDIVDDLMLAYRAVKHVKSNAIVIAKKGQLIGVGAGQMSRVEAAELAIKRCRISPEGGVAASDAFFPFRDGVDVLCDAGVVSIIQPGGSIRDSEVIEAANERGISMILTSRRHFRH